MLITSGFTPNPLYLLSRACGRTLLFNSVLVLVLVLRYSITILRYAKLDDQDHVRSEFHLMVMIIIMVVVIIFTFLIAILWYVKLDDHVRSAVRASLVIAILPEPEPITSLNLKQPTHLYVTELYPYIYLYPCPAPVLWFSFHILFYWYPVLFYSFRQA